MRASLTQSCVHSGLMVLSPDAVLCIAGFSIAALLSTRDVVTPMPPGCDSARCLQPSLLAGCERNCSQGGAAGVMSV